MIENLYIGGELKSKGEGRNSLGPLLHIPNAGGMGSSQIPGNESCMTYDVGRRRNDEEEGEGERRRGFPNGLAKISSHILINNLGHVT